jgi:hypothetical protein
MVELSNPDGSKKKQGNQSTVMACAALSKHTLVNIKQIKLDFSRPTGNLPELEKKYPDCLVLQNPEYHNRPVSL